MRPRSWPTKILIIDSYDSFTNNLAALVKKAVPSFDIYIIKNDELAIDALLRFLPYFSAVFIGPGPGSPLNASDVNVIKDLWRLQGDQLLPVLGVCLGLQSLAVAFGAALKRLRCVKHGQISRLIHTTDSLFKGVPQDSMIVRYHSLHVDLGSSEGLKTLAWADDGPDNGRVVMALKHKSRPFWAVQYHPESVSTDENGLRVIKNFWSLASQWQLESGRRVSVWDDAAERQFIRNRWPSFHNLLVTQCKGPKRRVLSSDVIMAQLDVTRICDSLGVNENSSDFVLLDSASDPGQYTIIGCIHPATKKIQYHVGDNFVVLSQGKQRRSCPIDTDIWTWIATFMSNSGNFEGESSVPFWGGLIGYLSYELGIDALRQGKHNKPLEKNHPPDANLAFIERSIVINTKTGNAIVQSLLPSDEKWISETVDTIVSCSSAPREHTTVDTYASSIPCTSVRIPNRTKYVTSIKKAQDYLFSGESYELCLTARTEILIPVSEVPRHRRSWEIYKQLRSKNPAPYAAYLRLHPVTLISSSPERFLSYSRRPSQYFQLRPIKGTVKKGGGITRDKAKVILSSPKEVGENLMIVDLIRHDLHGVIGLDVDVKKFCAIEEYKTVWQLVSVIEGAYPHKIASGDDSDYPGLGWEVLRRSLPPGSMTGAPKKRSVELLQGLENSNRGIYSGVGGYWCVGGGGDWSVIIRSCFSSEPDGPGFSSTSRCTERWNIGAGGAITALSDPDSEWEEMVVKLQSVLRVFCPSALIDSAIAPNADHSAHAERAKL